MILIVDDNPANVYTLELLLNNNNLDVDSASSGIQALEKALITEYELIILDVQMPEMDGFEVAKALAAIKRTKNIPLYVFKLTWTFCTNFLRRLSGYEFTNFC